MRSLSLAFLSTLLLSASVAHAQPVEPFEDASRLVTIGGSLTEIVFELGADDRLVARDSTSTYPERATELPIVAPAELPIGIVTASVGGPFFLYILLRRRNRLAW